MADARALLRQQQASRRISSPHALYSSTGKLSCALCREPVKTEALWDAHARSPSHRAALQAHAASQPRPAEPSVAGAKRKLEDDDDEEEDVAEDEGARRKRTRGDVAPPPAPTPASSASSSRASNTPSQGVELSIPSRPATPKTAAAPPNNTAETTQAKPADQSAPPIDEAEWAAFEADIAAATAPYSEDAVISAPAVPAGGGEPGDEDKGNTGERRAPRDVEIEAEREDAERALADEFDEMEELEARARKLKERREALRARPSADLKSAATKSEGDVKGAKGVDKENAGVEEEEESEEDGDEEDEDDYAWGGLRYAGRS
ncbi:hypothetical protein VUR80DRAFT_2451 [Thermomyces stellatus]